MISWRRGIGGAEERQRLDDARLARIRARREEGVAQRQRGGAHGRSEEGAARRNQAGEERREASGEAEARGGGSGRERPVAVQGWRRVLLR